VVDEEKCERTCKTEIAPKAKKLGVLAMTNFFATTPSLHSIKTYSTATRGLVALQKRKGKPQTTLEKI